VAKYATPGVFVKNMKTKDAGARMRKNVKTGDLGIHHFDLESLCFDIDANYWCSE
jgi:hypothetical protein